MGAQLGQDQLGQDQLGEDQAEGKGGRDHRQQAPAKNLAGDGEYILQGLFPHFLLFMSQKSIKNCPKLFLFELIQVIPIDSFN